MLMFSRFRQYNSDISMSSNISMLQEGPNQPILLAMSDTLNRPKKEERVQFLTTAEQLHALEEWMFSKRIRSQGEAIRRLIELGMQADPPQSNAA